MRLVVENGAEGTEGTDRTKADAKYAGTNFLAAKMHKRLKRKNGSGTILNNKETKQTKEREKNEPQISLMDADDRGRGGSPKTQRTHTSP